MPTMNVACPPNWQSSSSARLRAMIPALPARSYRDGCTSAASQQGGPRRKLAVLRREVGIGSRSGASRTALEAVSELKSATARCARRKNGPQKRSGPDDQVALGHQVADVADEDVEGILGAHRRNGSGPRQRNALRVA